MPDLDSVFKQCRLYMRRFEIHIQRSIKSVSIYLITFFLSSCALTVPVSEVMIFEEETTEISDLRSVFKILRYESSANRQFYSTTFENINRDKYKVMLDTTLNPLWSFNVNGISLYYRPSENFAIAVNPSLAFNAGTDFTLQPVNNCYITGSANLLGNYELILQSKVLETDLFHATIGADFRHEKQEYQFISQNKKSNTFDVNMVGIRAHLYFAELIHEGRIIISVFHELEHLTPIINIGISFSPRF